MSIPKWQLAKSAAELVDGEIDIWSVNLDPPNYACIDQNTSLFSDDELERARRFRFDRHRRQYLVGRGALRHILAHYAGMQPEQIVFEYGEYGKPSIKSFHIEFNLSNSHERAIVGVTQNGPIGVDIEYLDRHIRDVNALAESVFTEIEQAQLYSYASSERLIPFLSGWTRKEAYLKGVGKGLALPLKDFSVDLTNSTEEPSISVAGWRLKSFWSSEDYLCAVAYLNSGSPHKFKWFEWDSAFFEQM